MSYVRTQKQAARIQEVFIDSIVAAGHTAPTATNPIDAPAAGSGIDTLLVYIQPSATSQVVTLPTAAALAAANASGECSVKVKNLGTMAYAGTAPTAPDTIDGAAATYAPADNSLLPGGANTFDTVGTTGFAVS